MAGEYRLEMKNIDKHFGGVYSLKNAQLKVKPGEIHALMGENGAGKSTLMKILSGAITRDGGEILMEGKPVKILSPKDGKRLGVSIIYQEFVLAPDLTVAENIFIDRLAAKGSLAINWSKLYKDTEKLLASLGFEEIGAKTKIRELSVAYQQVVEICKALSRNTKILVLDEPTAVLTFSEIEKLFDLLRELKSQGVSIIYISHRLEEVYQLCDHVTILKDGEYVNDYNISDIDKNSLINSMVGRELTDLFPKRESNIGEEVLRVENLCSGNKVKNVSFTLHKGEVLGFSGLVGAGRTESMSVIFGADKKDTGKVIFKGKEVNFKRPKQAVKNGLGMLPEDRKQQGVLLDQSIKINTTLSNIKNITRALGIIKGKKEKATVKQLLTDLAVKYASMEDNVSSLSGGNQQKIAIAKWLCADCDVIIFDEPTRGVDVGAKVEIYKIINQLAQEGVGIIMISSEMPEIIGMCDRAVVMKGGAIVGELDSHEINENNLINLAMGVS